MSRSKKLGELLMEAGLLDDFQLQSALSHQRNWGGRLGAILVELGFLREEDVARVIAEKLRIPHAHLFEKEIPTDAVQALKPDVAKKYRVMPVKKEKNAITVAMADPLDITIIDDLRFITGLTIKPALAFESEITDALKKYYDHEEIVHRSHPLRKEPANAETVDDAGPGQGADVTKTEAENWSSPILVSSETDEQQWLQERIDMLITLLAEKGILTPQEFEQLLSRRKPR